MFLDHAIEMGIDEVQPRRGAPVSEQSRLDVFQRQGFLQQGIVKEINLANGEVISRLPVCMHGFQLWLRKHLRHPILFLFRSHRYISI